MYEIEDEIDWSDGPLGPSTPTNPDTAAVPKSSDSPTDPLFVAKAFDEHDVPSGPPLPITYELGGDNLTIPSRAQRAKIGVRLNRRQPTRDDYKNFALYQANQKAYEADVLKKFVAHAMHPDRVAECLEHSPHGSGGIAPYVQSVAKNIKCLANKMIWNAHCRAVNLLANDGADGVPFLDLQHVGQGMFSDFCYDNSVLVAGRMNESWHRAYPKPPMVRMSTKQYPTGCHSSPLEEIDETANEIFNNQAFTSKLATGRAIDPLSKKKGKGRGLPGMALRESMSTSARGTWLSFPSKETSHSPTAQHSTASCVRPCSAQQYDASNDDQSLELQLLQGLRNLQHEERDHTHLQTPMVDSNGVEPRLTRLEDLVDQYGAEALNSDRGHDIVHEVSLWRTTLLNDHKRRLTERSQSQTLRRALPGIKQVISEAVAMGFRCTDQDLRRKVTIIEAREQSQPLHRPSSIGQIGPAQYATELPLPSPVADTSQIAHTIRSKKNGSDAPGNRQKRVLGPPAKKKKRVAKKKQMVTTPSSSQSTASAQSQLHVEGARTHSPIRHLSGSRTLETHQVLPPDAYFEPQNQDEKPAWRCGIRHAMGFYYSAGDRTSCIGCFTNVRDNVKKKTMDFYLPSLSTSFQPAAGIIWKPSRPLSKPRRSKHLSHNSIAKEAYWPIFNANQNPITALQAGIDAVNEYLESRKPKEPTPEPTPEPEPDLGPHPSGSTTMEHGQDIPDCAYFEKQDDNEDSAWRCDLSHALGRYYLAGDKKSCPGCNSHLHGPGPKTIMDFYMPHGVVVRQEAPGLAPFKPRRPYNTQKSKAGISKKKQYLSHNQNCSRKYYEAFDAGHSEEEAFRIALAGLEAELNAKEADSTDEEHTGTREHKTSTSTGNSRRKASTNTSQTSSASSTEARRSPRRLQPVSSTVPAKRQLEVTSDDDDDDDHDVDEEEEDKNISDSPHPGTSMPAIIKIHTSSCSDEGEDTSGSDSE